MNTRSFLDLLFNALLVFVFMFIVSSMMIEVEKQQKGIKTQAEFVITLTWDLDNPDDIDLWLRDPTGLVGYWKQKEKGIMHLDRDDLGTAKDRFTLPDGTEIYYPYNQEIFTIRGIVPGWWVVNLHYWAKRSNGVVNVEVKGEKMNPQIKTIFLENFKLARQGDEITVARFNVTSGGEVIEVDKLKTPFVYDHVTAMNPGLWGGR